MIPYGRQNINKNDIDSVIQTLKSDFITQGPKTLEFEDKLANYCAIKYAAAVSSGTSALHLAYLAAGIREGDEVITTPNTFVATTNMLLAVGARPVFCDIRLDTYNIDEEKIEQLITPKTKAIVAVHFAGHPIHMDAISKIAKKYNLILIEDACHALGARYKEKNIGSIGDLTVFSFHPVKSITTGEGGAITTNNKKYYEKIIHLRSHGIKKDEEGTNIMTELGYNYRINDLGSTLGLSQLKRVDKFIKERQKVAKQYKKILEEIPEIILPVELPNNYSSWHIYVIRTKDANDRNPLRDYLKNKNIGVNFHYPAVYKHPYYRSHGYEDTALPEAETYQDSCITLPCFPGLKKEDIEYICAAIKEFYYRQSHIGVFDQLATHPDAKIRRGETFSFRRNSPKTIFEDVESKLGFTHNDTVLDIGGGTGEITGYLSPRSNSVVLSDGSRGALGAAKENLKRYSNIEFNYYDIIKDDYPFKDKKFDKILCYSVIHYLNNYKQLESLINNLASSLKPGGLLLIGDIPLAEKKERYLAERKKHIMKNFGKNLIYHFKNFFTKKIYKKHKILSPFKQELINLNEKDFQKMMSRISGNKEITFKLVNQDNKLAYATSRMDLLIKKL